MNRKQRRSLTKRGVAEAVVGMAQKEIEKDTVTNYSAMILWTLHTEFGFGKERIKRFHTALEEISWHIKHNETSGMTIDSIRKALHDECGVTIKI